MRGWVSARRIRSMIKYGKIVTFGLILALIGSSAARAGSPKPPKEPAKLQIEVAPGPLAPGDHGTVTVRLTPKDGIKINRYPKIKLELPEQTLLQAGATASIGNDSPPPPERADDNYYEVVDPVALSFEIDGDAASGEHAIEGKLTYFYCVTASGFCAPARVPLTIPVEVR